MKDTKIIPKNILKLTWDELMQELHMLPNCCVDAQHFIVGDLTFWLNKQVNFIDTLKINGVDLRNDDRAKLRKKQLREVLLATENPKNIYEVGTMPERWGSIYPLK